MKKIISMILVVIMLFVLCSCKNTETETQLDSTTTRTSTSTPTPTTSYTTPVITKNPTSETKNVGDTTSFIATATNYQTVEWYCLLPTNSIIKAADLSNSFAGVNANGYNTETLAISNIQAGMNGCQFYATFTNGDKTNTSTGATLSVIQDIVITHNPTSETRNLGTDWYWDNDRQCARNDNQYLYFTVAGENYTSIQWYIYTDHASPAGNYAGVTGANSETLAIPARSDLSGCTVYAVLSNTQGKTAQTSSASYYVYYDQKIVVTTKNIYCSCYGEGGYIASCPSSATVGNTVTFQLGVSNSQAFEQVTISTCNTGLDIPYSINGINYSFTMPNDDVYISVYWTTPTTE